MSESKARIDVKFFAKCNDITGIITLKEVDFDKVRSIKDLENLALELSKEQFSEVYDDVSNTTLLSEEECKKYIEGDFNE